MERYILVRKRNKFKGWKFHSKKNQVMTICSGVVEFFKKRDQ